MFYNINLLFCEILLSLPSRERGLKSQRWRQRQKSTSSLPSRERGLKFSGHRPQGRREKSLPSRERGLKLYSSYGIHRSFFVAPFAGAWIEIQIRKYQIFLVESLPSRERGLKYAVIANVGNIRLSLPLRERGLK